MLGFRAIERRMFSVFRCPKCGHTQEGLNGGSDEVATCYGCNQQIPRSDFGTAHIKRWVAACAECGQSVSLRSRPGVVCTTCNNVVALHYGNRVVSPEHVLRLDWSPAMVARSRMLTNGWRWGTCRTKKDHLVGRTLFLLARQEDGSFIYGSESGHRTMVVFNDQQFLAYLLWSDDRGPAGKREPVLRQLFVRKEFRREGIGTAMVKTWAIDVDGLFEVEEPNSDAKRILAKLGCARINGPGTRWQKV